MKLGVSSVRLLLVLLAFSLQSYGKGDTVQITIQGGDLASPIEITDPELISGFRIWSGPGTRSSPAPSSNNEDQSFIVDWSRGEAEAPRSLPVYRVSFATTRTGRPSYVVCYAVDHSNNKAYVYLPGKADTEYKQNVSLILRKVEGKWFHAWSAWETLAHPLIEKARRTQ